MNEIGIQYCNKYVVRPTRWQALRAFVTGKAFQIKGRQVSPLIEFGAGTTKVHVEAWGSGGGGGE